MISSAAWCCSDQDRLLLYQASLLLSRERVTSRLHLLLSALAAWCGSEQEGVLRFLILSSEAITSFKRACHFRFAFASNRRLCRHVFHAFFRFNSPAAISGPPMFHLIFPMIHLICWSVLLALSVMHLGRAFYCKATSVIPVLVVDFCVVVFSCFRAAHY